MIKFVTGFEKTQLCLKRASGTNLCAVENYQSFSFIIIIIIIFVIYMSKNLFSEVRREVQRRKFTGSSCSCCARCPGDN